MKLTKEQREKKLQKIYEQYPLKSRQSTAINMDDVKHNREMLDKIGAEIDKLDAGDN